MEEYIEQTVQNTNEYDSSATEEEYTTTYVMQNSGEDIDEVINKYKDGSIIQRADFLGHTENRDNPHKITKKMINLGNVNNTSDANKPVSIATQKALDKKLDKSNKAGGFVGGSYAKAENELNEDIDAIQLGTGTNSSPKTLQVYDKRIVEEDGSLSDVGALKYLMTEDKSSIISAINELIDSLSLKANLNEVFSVPVGTIIYNVSNKAPEGYLRCDGREIDRAEFINLYKIIGTTYGCGNNKTTFNLPNIKSDNLSVEVIEKIVVEPDPEDQEVLSTEEDSSNQNDTLQENTNTSEVMKNVPIFAYIKY